MVAAQAHTSVRNQPQQGMQTETSVLKGTSELDEACQGVPSTEVDHSHAGNSFSRAPSIYVSDRLVVDLPTIREYFQG